MVEYILEEKGDFLSCYYDLKNDVSLSVFFYKGKISVFQILFWSNSHKQSFDSLSVHYYKESGTVELFNSFNATKVKTLGNISKFNETDIVTFFEKNNDIKTLFAVKKIKIEETAEHIIKMHAEIKKRIK